MTLGVPAVRVLLLHAHPDDETLATGGVIARLVDEGVEVSLLTATRGEAGEVVPDVLPAGADLMTHRLGELATAVAALGVAHHYWLGDPPARAAGLLPRRYTDSGMRWGGDGRAVPALDVAPDALTSAPLEEVTADVEALVERVRPDVVVSYDAGGGYGHPDHVRVHDAALVVARRRGTPYFAVIPADEADPVAGVVVVDVSVQRPRVLRALAAHASQLTVLDAEHVRHVGGQEQHLPTVEYFRRLS